MKTPYAKYIPFDCDAQNIPFSRGIFCNRTLNLNAIKAIGYDMDYTLIHYNVEHWEERAYEETRLRLLREGWPVDNLRFSPDSITRGLVLDLELGNVVKANRFGYIKRAAHGTKVIPHEKMRKTYSRTIVDLSEPRWVFLNTFFSISEAWLFSQLVELLDVGELEHVTDYAGIYKKVRHSIDSTHMEGKIKAEMMANPQRFVELDPEMPLALLDQKHAGKKMILITNSEWPYTRFMMAYAFNQFLPEGTTWRDIFDIVVVSARKPDFFSYRAPVFVVADEEKGLLAPHISLLEEGHVYLGGNAWLVEESLQLRGGDILYVGDHLFGDVQVSKNILRWRTALILRELEHELACVDRHRREHYKIQELMEQKEILESQICALRLDLLRKQKQYAPSTSSPEGGEKKKIELLQREIEKIDAKVGPLVQIEEEEANYTWGHLMRTGNDKSHLTRQVERYADIYTSRVSNFLYYTPFMYFRSPRGSMPHDHAVMDAKEEADHDTKN
jgi:HAD superfamily 5'-nucleotidase-like hydrolase